MQMIARRIRNIQQSVGHLLAFMESPAFTNRNFDPEVCDFALGNPQEVPLPEYVQALQNWVVPQNKDWFAYKMSEPESCRVVAESLGRWRGVAYKPEDIFMTSGAFSALAVALNAIIDPGDEVIFISPPWFFYEALILTAYGVPVRVKMNPESFDLDLDAIQAAITPKTRAIIINSPNNPTGKIYTGKTLKSLAQVLTQAGERAGRPIYLLSDEAYSRIVYDGRKYISPTQYYPYSFLLYTYGKTLLTPGQRIGYIALPPEMPGIETLREALTVSQFVTGYAFPNALLQHALPDLEQLSIDISRLQARRDRLVASLIETGYEVHVPEGTFYLLPRSPIPDDVAFVNMLVEHKIFCLPGTVAEMPGYFRISLTANDDMVERALPRFAAAFEKARQEALVRA